MANTHLIRNVVPVVIEGIQPAPGCQGQGCQVVAGPAGIQQDHSATHCSRLAHTGPLARMTREDPQGGEAPHFLCALMTTAQRSPRTPGHQGLWPYLGLQVDASGGGPSGDEAEAGSKREGADDKEGVAHQDTHQQ